MPAIAVPWPLGSAVPFAPGSSIDAPGTMLPARSGCEASTPVSSSATVADPPGATEPKTWSQPIFGSAHCEPYSVSLGTAVAARVSSVSTRATLWSARSWSAAASDISTVCRRSAETCDSSVAPTPAKAAAWSASDVPATNVTRYRPLGDWHRCRIRERIEDVGAGGGNADAREQRGAERDHAGASERYASNHECTGPMTRSPRLVHRWGRRHRRNGPNRVQLMNAKRCATCAQSAA